ncbi:MAG: Rrf2 family transcriptional regulator [Planctomycetes bacterium]|jgi:Rrf2 family protein|nr:Rrf2 family transcriptional regulator [Phycisphaerae bacterium]NBB94773.1 Rrf2 family transcriptional regulator [Planctomycetota bacterium]
MRLSKRSEYALLALIDLAEHDDVRTVAALEISKRKHIPKKYLDQILNMLKRGGYVRSYRGAEGGYHLAKDAGEISLADVIRLLDGPLAPVESVSRHFHEHTPIEQNRKLLDVFRDIRDAVARKLETTTVADLV